MQQHAHAQAVGKDAGHQASVAGAARFFFDDAGQNQGLLSRFQGRVAVTLAPGSLQAPVHGVQRAAQDGHVARPFGVGIGIRKKPSLRVHARPLQELHDGGVTQRCRIGLERVIARQGSAHLAKIPALHQGQGTQ